MEEPWPLLMLDQLDSEEVHGYIILVDIFFQYVRPLTICRSYTLKLLKEPDNVVLGSIGARGGLLLLLLLLNGTDGTGLGARKSM